MAKQIKVNSDGRVEGLIAFPCDDCEHVTIHVFTGGAFDDESAADEFLPPYLHGFKCACDVHIGCGGWLRATAYIVDGCTNQCSDGVHVNCGMWMKYPDGYTEGP